MLCAVSAAHVNNQQSKAYHTVDRRVMGVNVIEWKLMVFCVRLRVLLH